MRWPFARKADAVTVLHDYPTDARTASRRAGASADPEEERRFRRRRRAVLATIAVVFGVGSVLSVFGEGGWLDLRRLEGEVASRREDVALQQSRVRALERQVRLLADDPMARERLAREELGFVRPGEVDFLLPRDPPEPRRRP